MDVEQSDGFGVETRPVGDASVVDSLDLRAYVAAIVESSDDAIYGTDPDGVIQIWNRGACRLLGYDAAEMLGRPSARLVGAERADEEVRIMARALKGERTDHVVTDRLSKDGARVEVSLTVAPISSPDGSIIGVLSTARDIGALVRARRRAEVSAAVSHILSEVRLDEEAMLAVVAKHLGVAFGDSCVISLIDAESRSGATSVHHESPAAAALLRRLVAAATPASMGAQFSDDLRIGRPVRLAAADADELRCLADKRFWSYLERFPMYACLLAPVRHEDQVLGAIALWRSRRNDAFTADDEVLLVDLGERIGLAVANARLYRAARDELVQRRDAEASLRASEERFRRLAENAPVVIFRYRMAEHSVEYISPAIVDLLGYEPADVYADSSLVLGAADPQEVYATFDYYENLNQQIRPLVSRRRHRDGHEVWIETRAVPLVDDDGRMVGIEGITTDITAVKEAEAELLRRAAHDDLTGLANRSLFLDDVNQALSHASEEHSSVAVLFLDLDRFKVINDSLGHAIGDKVLCDAAQRLRVSVGPTDTVARLGGDEFAIAVDCRAGPAVATQLAERILCAFRRPFSVDGQTVHSTVSIGISYSAAGVDLASDLLRHADAALYVAKGRGRDRFEVFDDGLRSHLHERLRTETEIRRAVEAGEFVLHYQPIFAIPEHRLIGVEALIRWNHPTRGLVAAGEFVELAEDCGLMVKLGQWVFEEAGAQHRRWQEQGIPLQMAINLSAAQLNDPDGTDRIATILGWRGIEPDSVCLEITETALMHDVEGSLRRLEVLKDLGVRLAIDDFGTGYSSLTYLQRFPIDAVKIDKSFVGGLGTDSHDGQIVNAILSLARALDLTTVAEGVETPEQLAALVALGCDSAQGYLLGYPIPPDELERVAAGEIDPTPTAIIEVEPGRT